MSDYVLWKEETVNDPAYDRRIFAKKYNFMSESELESYDNHDLFSEWGDVTSPQGYHYALRYAYSQNDSTTESKTGKSREFCQIMVDLSKGGTMYRYEDISDMSADGVNGQFAAAGQSTYDIFTQKGGVNCFHSWIRKIYIYSPGGEPNTEALEQIAQDEWDKAMVNVGNNPYVPQLGDEAYRPIDGRKN